GSRQYTVGGIQPGGNRLLPTAYRLPFQLKKFSPNKSTGGSVTTFISPCTVTQHANRIVSSWPIYARQGSGSGTGVGSGFLNFTFSITVIGLAFCMPSVINTRQVPHRPKP